MTTNVNEALSAIQDSFLIESIELKTKLQSNLLHIKELDYYIKKYAATEDDNLADELIFSPHGINNKDINLLKKSEISREKDALEEENHQLLKEIDILDERINNINEVISVDPFLNRFVFLDMQEKERQRIARDLHDSSLQNMIHLIHSIELSSLFIDRDPQRAKLELKTIAQKIRTVIKEMRETIYDLRPMEFDDLGFQEAVKNMIDKQQKETDIFINLEMDKKITVTNELIFSNIYRIIRECIANAIKHSLATEINIRLYEDNNMFYVEVIDDGIGFDDESRDDDSNHFGLQILEERVQFLKGSLNIYSSGETGTDIRISIPTDSI
ncbi:MAG: sensor histidine kinase [Lachnospiraceae bacterium]|nr:sensor histidine kinase [Lachnospiraceae bacterium]